MYTSNVKISDDKWLDSEFDFLFSITLNCSPILFMRVWMAVLLPMKVAAIFSLVGGMSQTAVLMLFGIHSAKEEQFLFCTW